MNTLEQERGGLDAVERILFLRGYIHAPPEFQDHSRIRDPASRLLHEIFGEGGHHARSAVGVASLPYCGSVKHGGRAGPVHRSAILQAALIAQARTASPPVSGARWPILSPNDMAVVSVSIHPAARYSYSTQLMRQVSS
jgi:hypothetical protein